MFVVKKKRGRFTDCYPLVKESGIVDILDLIPNTVEKFGKEELTHIIHFIISSSFQFHIIYGKYKNKIHLSLLCHYIFTLFYLEIHPCKVLGLTV